MGLKEDRKVGSLKRRVEPFGQLREMKIARRCDMEHIWKSKCPKHHTFGELLKVEMLKKCKLLWGEAHVEVKMHKKHYLGALLEIEMLNKCTLLWRETHISKSTCTKHTILGALLEVVARCTFQSQNVQSTPFHHSRSTF